jgi:hypothetical protein
MRKVSSARRGHRDGGHGAAQHDPEHRNDGDAVSGTTPLTRPAAIAMIAHTTTRAWLSSGSALLTPKVCSHPTAGVR